MQKCLYPKHVKNNPPSLSNLRKGAVEVRGNWIKAVAMKQASRTTTMLKARPHGILKSSIAKILGNGVNQKQVSCVCVCVTLHKSVLMSSY